VDVLLTTLGLVAPLVAVLTLWINFRSYRLQKGQGVRAPGRKIETHEAIKALDDIDEGTLRRVAADHIFIQSEKTGVGYIEDNPIAVYLDMHSAACDPAKRMVLAQSLADFIEETLGTGLDHTSIASPREGNIIVGASVAELLGLNFLMIRTGRAPRFGYPIEGVFLPGTSAVLVDDLCMEGSFLTRCIKYLRTYGLNVSHCVCLFERLDGDARAGLTHVQVELHSRYQIDDDALKQLKQFGLLVPNAQPLQRSP
jgi:orotate phosphoribosyltransferase